MLLTKNIIVKWSKRNKKHFISKGYSFTNFGEKFKVIVEDLPKSSTIKIECLCDYCLEQGIKTKIVKPYYKYNKKFIDIVHKDCCYAHRKNKTKESNLIKYGVSSVFSIPSIRNRNKKLHESQKLSFKEIEDRCKQFNYILVTKKDEYKNVKSKIKIICPKHGLQETTWSSFKYTCGCKKCGNEKITNKLSISGQDVYNDFIKSGFEPKFNPKDYIGCKRKLPYICPKHRDKGIQYKTYDNLKNKTNFGCPYCVNDNNKGANNPNWNGGSSSERDILKHSKEYKEWRKQVFERDNYTCQCCGDNSGGNLEAHHIENFSDHEELRFNINNGITLCNKCHNPNQKGSFHNIQGTHNNTKVQLEEYIKNYKINNKR